MGQCNAPFANIGQAERRVLPVKKTIKIKFVGKEKGFEPDWCIIWNAMVKHYDVQIVEDDPDYIICDIFGAPPYGYCHYPQIRILENGENFIPDFNVVDYAVSRYPVQLQDRNFYLPGCAARPERFLSLAEKDRNYTSDTLAQKEFFASFIASHESENNVRGDFFKKLSKYKRVESPGTYLYNMTDGTSVRWDNDSKINFQRRCKFSLCFESTAHYGFITEKLVDAFCADTIPVYFGDPNVGEIFNRDAFINVADYPTMEDAIARIIELDNDDEQYLQMLRQPILVDPSYPQRLYKDLETFVCHIFDQPVENAYRRCRVFAPKHHENFLVWADKRYKFSVKGMRYALSVLKLKLSQLINR